MVWKIGTNPDWTRGVCLLVWKAQGESCRMRFLARVGFCNRSEMVMYSQEIFAYPG